MPSSNDISTRNTYDGSNLIERFGSSSRVLDLGRRIAALKPDKEATELQTEYEELLGKIMEHGDSRTAPIKSKLMEMGLMSTESVRAAYKQYAVAVYNLEDLDTPQEGLLDACSAAPETMGIEWTIQVSDGFYLLDRVVTGDQEDMHGTLSDWYINMEDRTEHYSVAGLTWSIETCETCPTQICTSDKLYWATPETGIDVITISSMRRYNRGDVAVEHQHRSITGNKMEGSDSHHDSFAGWASDGEILFYSATEAWDSLSVSSEDSLSAVTGSDTSQVSQTRDAHVDVAMDTDSDYENWS